MTRRMMGRGAAAGGVLAVLGLVAGCGGTPAAEVAEVCAAATNPPLRVEDRVCAEPRNRGEAEDHGWYEIQLPQAYTEYDEYGDAWTVYPAIVVVDVGQRLPAAGTAGAGTFRTSTVGAPAIRPPAVANGTTISRGGLGISGYGGSSGS